MKIIELERWKPSQTDPHRREYAGQRTAQEVFEELKYRLESSGYLPDEYFELGRDWQDGQEVPKDADIFCTTDYGGSEGIYLDVYLALATNEKARKAVSWIIVAILSPLIVVVALLCSLGSGAATHNVSTVELCFRGGTIPDSVPEEYRIYIEDMRKSLSQLDELITTANGQMEDGTSLDETLVKAIFYALYFGADAPSQRAQQEFLNCFVVYTEQSRTVSDTDEEGNEIEVEETYTTADPVEDLSELCQRLSETLGVTITDEQRNNVESIRSLIEYGWTGGAEWGGELGSPVMSVTGFCSPLGEGWRSRITSDFGYRNCPYHGRELHSGLDMAAPSGTPIRAALAGTVTRSCFTNSYE